MHAVDYYARLMKVSTMGYSAQGELQEYEEMTPAKWKQTAKDLAIGGVGMGVGYGVSRLAADKITDKMMRSKQGWKMLKKYGPTVAAAASTAAAVGLRMRSEKFKEKRERAEARHQVKLHLRAQRLRRLRARPSPNPVYVDE